MFGVSESADVTGTACTAAMTRTDPFACSLSYEQTVTQFALWAIARAPLIMTADFTRATARPGWTAQQWSVDLWSLLTNNDLLYANQLGTDDAVRASSEVGEQSSAYGVDIWTAARKDSNIKDYLSFETQMVMVNTLKSSEKSTAGQGSKVTLKEWQFS